MDAEKKLPYLSLAKVIPLWVLVFFNGWFIMQTEIVGARALTPYFGNSIFVWGSVIAVFLLTLAIGYSLGGKLTKKFHSHWTPAFLLIIAGVLVGLSTTYQDPLCAKIASSSFDLKWGALIAAMLLYAVPMVLAGTISPYSVHLATGARSEVGSRAGTLYAVSTIGSFLGSLIASFSLIPSYSLQIGMLSGGVLAIIAAIIAAVSLSIPDKPAALISLAFAAVAIGASMYSPRHIDISQHQVYAKSIIGGKISDAEPSTLNERLAQGQKEAFEQLKKYGNKPGEQVLLKTETAYHRVMVTQEGPVRMLTFGELGFKLPQTTINLNNITKHVTEYTGMMFAPILYKHDMKRVLMIGLGAADIARGIETCYPNVQMDIVELDPAMVEIAQKYFFWKPSKNVNVYTMDGRSFLNLHVVKKKQPYDWVILDAFDNDFVPFHMTTVEFYSLLRYVMSPDGILAINTRIDHQLYSYQARTVQAAFGDGKNPGTVDAYMGHRSGNMILVAQNNAKQSMTPENALESMKTLKLADGAAVDLKYVTTCLLPKPNWKQKGDILTDTWAPVERMLQAK